MVYFHFTLLPDCISIRKSISRDKCGILPKGPKDLRKYVCYSLAVARQWVHDSYQRKPTIDCGGYKREATERVHDESPRYTQATPGNQLVIS
jgi:hypothetical protein